jgi:hypothetical protein
MRRHLGGGSGRRAPPGTCPPAGTRHPRHSAPSSEPRVNASVCSAVIRSSNFRSLILIFRFFARTSRVVPVGTHHLAREAGWPASVGSLSRCTFTIYGPVPLFSIHLPHSNLDRRQAHQVTLWLGDLLAQRSCSSMISLGFLLRLMIVSTPPT